MTLAVVAISAICILLVLGYRFDLKHGDVEQGALVQFRSYPTNATITLDKEVLSFRTPGKRNVSVGDHAVTMQLDGYQVWKKSFTAKAQELKWLNYARLVPENLQTVNVKEFPAIASALPSPDRKWLLLLNSADKPEFTLVDIRDEKKPVFSQFVLPAESYTAKDGQPSQFSVEEWDFGARYVLVKHTVGDTAEYLRIDRTDADQTVNVSAKLGLDLEDLHFSGTSGNVFYGLEGGSVRKLDSGSGTISQPVVKDVASFRLYKTSTISYVKTPIEGKIGVGIVVDDKAQRIATFDDTVPVYADINEYFNDYYLAIGRGTSVVLYKNPELNTRVKFANYTTTSAISYLRLSSSGRFLVAGTGSQFTTYDLETREKFDVNLPGTPADPTKPLQWLDDYYMVSTADNDLRITEFDGTNQHVLTSSLSGYAVSLDDDGKMVYSVSKTQSGSYVLQGTRMTTQK